MSTADRIVDAPNLNYLAAGILVEELVRNGVEWFVICPGSRSAPLAWAIAAHPEAKHVVHHDERGAAFHALGLAKCSDRATVFVCTSGSAAANALPAVVEADQAGVPLILLTADRPPHLIETGANQTIRQGDIYGDYPRWRQNLVVAEGVFRAAHLLTTVDQACARATAAWPGPVQLNCQFDEPLVPDALPGRAPDWRSVLTPVQRWLDERVPFTRYAGGLPCTDDAETREIAARIARTPRGLVVVGQLRTPGEAKHAGAIIKRLGWPAIPDVTSGLRLNAASPWALPYSLHYAEDLFESADAVVHLGGAITSRRLLELLAAFPAERSGLGHVRISPAPVRLDPAHNVSLRVESDLANFSRFLALYIKRRPPNRWTEDYSGYDNAVYTALSEAFKPREAINEPGVAYHVSLGAPESSVIFLGSSMPIRDMDLFGCAPPSGPWAAANRGASGIDGNIATAAGIARVSQAPVAAIVGDLAALHDLNSLALLRDIQTPFALVVVNNDGGGIFHFLPIAKHAEHFEKMFVAPHGLNFESAAKMYDLPYKRPITHAEFRDAYAKAMDRQGPSVIEVRSDRARNVTAHNTMDERVRAALDMVRG